MLRLGPKSFCKWRIDRLRAQPILQDVAVFLLDLHDQLHIHLSVGTVGILSEVESVLPPDAGMNCVGYRVRMLSRVITGIYDDALAPLKLKGSQFNLLDVVSRRGSSAPSEIYKLTKMDKSTASRNLERMRRRGWLAIEGGGEGRGQTISITAKGTRTLRAAYPLWKKAQKEALRRLGPDGFRALQVVMRSVNGQ